MSEFVSSLGCLVKVRPAPEHLAPGWMLSLRVDHPGQVGSVASWPEGGEREPIQYAEVYLSEEDRAALLAALGAVA